MDGNRRDTAGSSPAPPLHGGSPATEPPPPPRRRGQKRKSNHSSSSAPPKRHAREKAAAAAAIAAAGMSAYHHHSPIHNGPLTRARQLSDNNAALNAVRNEKVTAVTEFNAVVDGNRDEASKVKKEEDYEALEAKIEAEFDAIRSRDASVHVVPVAAGWFSWANIHLIEKQTLQSFFNGKSESRTPEIYMEIRNWLMKRFHENPSSNIEFNDLLALSIGDLEARQEIMEFLDHWGLINYHPFPPSDPANIDADPETDVDKAEKTDALIEKLYQFETEQSCQQTVSVANKSMPAMPTGLFRDSAIAEELVKQEGPSVEYHCNSCSADCSRKRYHCQKQADFDLCTECYNNGKFGSGMCPSDFILMEPAEASGASGGKWTDQETLLLLEALELFKENWNEIAEHVATKTKAQCILHFLQMPIEDDFLDYDDTKDGIQQMEEPASINNDLPVNKDNAEQLENKTAKENSESAETGNSKLNSEQSENKTAKDDPEQPQSKDATNAAQPVSTPMETSILEDPKDGKVSYHSGDDVVLKALKDAFDAVDTPLDLKDKFSFAEAGNPVMALAAFISRLVEPGVATASARCSLKSMSRSSAGSLLAARHCFVLEDPPDDKKDRTGSENAAVEKIDQNVPMLVNQESKSDREINHDVENSTKPDNPSERQEICADTQATNKSEEEKSQVAEKSGDEKSEVEEKPGEGKSGLAEKPDEKKSQNVKNLDETSIEQTGLKVMNEPQNTLLQNDQSPANPKDQEDCAAKVNPSGPAKESGNVNGAGEADQCAQASKDVGVKHVLSDKTEQQETILPNPVIGVGSETVGQDKMEVDKTGDQKSKEATETKDDPGVVKLKRAAVATLSAAAVKAKLLAIQEEDVIRQLATLLIEKQMRKLEVKLSFFTDMDNAIMRVREQLERSRQKLYNERAQIIASRLGLSASSSRGLPPSFPMNRMPPGLLNSMMRPPMGTTAQRPPISKSVMASAAPEMTEAGPAQPTAQGKPSSIGTN